MTAQIIAFPIKAAPPIGRIDTAIQYAAMPAAIVRNAVWNRIATALQSKGWSLTVTPGFIQCRHPQIESGHPVGLSEAFEIQKILDGRKI